MLSLSRPLKVGTGVCLYYISVSCRRNFSTASFALQDQASIQKILQLYPDDPSIGVPTNTGDGLLPSGMQDKRVREELFILHSLTSKRVDFLRARHSSEMQLWLARVAPSRKLCRKVHRHFRID